MSGSVEWSQPAAPWIQRRRRGRSGTPRQDIGPSRAPSEARENADPEGPAFRLLVGSDLVVRAVAAAMAAALVVAGLGMGGAALVVAGLRRRLRGRLRGRGGRTVVRAVAAAREPALVVGRLGFIRAALVVGRLGLARAALVVAGLGLAWPRPCRRRARARPGRPCRRGAPPSARLVGVAAGVETTRSSLPRPWFPRSSPGSTARTSPIVVVGTAAAVRPTPVATARAETTTRLMVPILRISMSPDGC